MKCLHCCSLSGTYRQSNPIFLSFVPPVCYQEVEFDHLLQARTARRGAGGTAPVATATS